MTGAANCWLLARIRRYRLRCICIGGRRVRVAAKGGDGQVHQEGHSWWHTCSTQPSSFLQRNNSRTRLPITPIATVHRSYKTLILSCHPRYVALDSDQVRGERGSMERFCIGDMQPTAVRLVELEEWHHTGWKYFGRQRKWRGGQLSSGIRRWMGQRLTDGRLTIAMCRDIARRRTDWLMLTWLMIDWLIDWFNSSKETEEEEEERVVFLWLFYLGVVPFASRYLTSESCSKYRLLPTPSSFYTASLRLSLSLCLSLSLSLSCSSFSSFYFCVFTVSYITYSFFVLVWCGCTCNFPVI